MDPNIRSGSDAMLEASRILSMKDGKRLYTDTQVTTTTFLKNCIKVPKRLIKSEANPYGISK